MIDRQRNKKHSPYKKQTHLINFIVTDCYYEDEIVRLSFGRFGLSKWQKIEKQHFVPELLGRRKISLSQAGAKRNESIEKHLFNTDENPTILDRVNRYKRCLDTRRSATHASWHF